MSWDEYNKNIKKSASEQTEIMFCSAPSRKSNFQYSFNSSKFNPRCFLYTFYFNYEEARKIHSVNIEQFLLPERLSISIHVEECQLLFTVRRRICTLKYYRIVLIEYPIVFIIKSCAISSLDLTGIAIHKIWALQ